ncbi:hypothetical protein B0T22DRAFT_484448 [Podospora appendiculata]|uniref:HNH nuclease domain-containing protein n=1 Tax=Podospora appendiculata TaxID=314037 RepID=A0AAE0X0W0_9PEZI|nr:hypothetical protein B0T22DRAFT_484448 [Podospora appendiculata]
MATTATTDLPSPIDRSGVPRPIPILAPPQARPEPHNALLVLHPNYGDASNVIFSLPCALDRAHIVPTAQASWFDDNGMSRYGTSVSPSIDDDCNLLWLRRDLHTPTFDAFWFALVPKPVVATATTTITTTTTLPHLRGVAREFLFARFAQAVFIRVKPFVTARKRRLIARFVIDGIKEEVIREELSGDALFKAYGGGLRGREG